MLKKFLPFMLVLVSSYVALAPLLAPGFFPMHDATQVARVYEMKKALLDGQFPVRWVSDLGYGYGYPIFHFYSPLPYYIGAFFAIIGFDALVATKFMFAVGILLSGIFMFFLSRRLVGDWGGLLSAILYQYAPYHALDIYVRGAVGEFYALAFLPLFLFGFLGVLQKGIMSPWTDEDVIWRDILIGGFGLASIILSHNITAMLLMVTLIVVLPVLIFISKWFILLHSKMQLVTSVGALLYLGAVGLTLSAFFWLPAVAEMDYTNVVSTIGGKADYHDHFVYIDQLWDSTWGYGGSAPGRIDGMSFKIGKIQLLAGLAGFAIVVWLLAKKQEKKAMIPLIVCAGTLLWSIFMMTASSVGIWDVFPFLSYAQYPWRFMVLVICALSLLAGYVVWLPKVIGQAWFRLVIPIVLIISFAAVAINMKYFKPQFVDSTAVESYTDVKSINWYISKISDEYLPAEFNKPNQENEVVSSKITSVLPINIQSERILSNRYLFEVNLPQSTEFIVNTAYFPGWKIFIDQIPVSFTTYHNLMQATITSGQHSIQVELHDTPVRTFANIISILSFLFITGKILPIRRLMARL